MAIFKGAGVALVTPFHEDGSVNYKKLDELLDYQISNGTDAIIVTGTTGEAPTLELDEHYEVIRRAVQYVNHRVPVIAGTGSNNTKTAIRSTQEAEKAGADALLCVTPYYNKCTQKGLIADFKAIAASTDLPIIMYSIQGRTGVNIEPATCAELFETVDNIVGVKEASGNISQVAKIMELTKGKIELYSGNDDQIVPLMSLGGCGVISVLSNIAPRETHDIVDLYLQGRVAESRDLQLRAITLIDKLFCEVNPIPVKKAMNMMGMEVGPLRLPLTEMEDGHAEELKKAMIDFGIQVK